MNISKKLDNLSVYISWMKKLWKPGKKTAYFLGTPEHKNLGDSAIVIAQKHFLKHCGFKEIVEITVKQLWDDGKCIGRLIPKKSPIFLIGGGNMGNQWMPEEQLRRKIITDFSGHPMVSFPQTIYYTPDENGEAEAQKSVSIYNKEKNLTVVAREEMSYQIMRKLYPDISVLKTPDIVLSTTMETFGVVPQERRDVLLCMRNDAERSMTDDNRAQIEFALKQCGLEYRYMDMYSDCPVTVENREKCVWEKMQEFTRAKLVITDRLHGMIFAAITGTPCIVFSNYNHKVRGTYEWIKYLPYIRYAESVEDVEMFLPELLAMENCKFDGTPLKPYFDTFAETIKKGCR